MQKGKSEQLGLQSIRDARELRRGAHRTQT